MTYFTWGWLLLHGWAAWNLQLSRGRLILINHSNKAGRILGGLRALAKNPAPSSVNRRLCFWFNISFWITSAYFFFPPQIFYDWHMIRQDEFWGGLRTLAQRFCSLLCPQTSLFLLQHYLLDYFCLLSFFCPPRIFLWLAYAPKASARVLKAVCAFESLWSRYIAAILKIVQCRT